MSANGHFLVGIVLFPLLLGYALLLVLASRVNMHIKKDTPPSLRRDSATRWNFWTVGFSVWGGIVRLAFSNSVGMDEKSEQLRSWARKILFTPFALSLLSAACPPTSKLISALLDIATIYVVVYFAHKLTSNQHTKGTPLAAAGKEVSVWFHFLIGICLIYFLGSSGKGADASFTQSFFLIVFVLSAALLSLKVMVHLSRMLILVGIEGKSGGESENTPRGGLDFLLSLAYLGVILASTGIISAILLVSAVIK